MFYSCQEVVNELNSDGQTREEVQGLKLEATLAGNKASKTLNTAFTKTTKHRVQISAFVKDLEKYDQNKIDSLEWRVSKILGGYDSSPDHQRSAHSPSCHSESSRVFAELDAKR